MENKIIDVIYDDNVIYHALEPNAEGIRGVPISQMFIRDTIVNVRGYLSNLDQTKIDEFEQELLNEL